MGQLVLGFAGAAIGSMAGPMGAQIGWLLGQFAWNLLDPPKVYGPRLNDTKVQGADYGVMVPIIYGSVRIGGIGMGQGSTVNGPNQFTEHEESTGGKGGPEMISYRYTLSFFNEICEGPILGVRKRWGNGRLLTDSTTDSEDNWPYTLYVGTATQLPDPTMEIIYGTGNVCPMRGRAYESVEEVNVEDFGNARPNIEYEVFTNAGVFPWRVSTFDPVTPAYEMRSFSARSDGGGAWTLGMWDRPSYANGFYVEQRFSDLDGTPDGAYTETDVVGSFPNRATKGGPLVASDGSTWFAPVDETVISSNPAGGAGSITPVDSQIIYPGSGDYLYARASNTIPGTNVLARWPAPGGEIDVTSNIHDAVSSAIVNDTPESGMVLGGSNNGMVYLANANDTPRSLHEYDADLNLVRSWDLSTEHAISPIINGGDFVVWQSPMTGRLVLACDRGTAGNKQFFCFYLEDDLTLTQVGGVDYDDGGMLAQIGATPYVVVNDGIICLEPPPAPVILGDIVADLLERDGLTNGQFDVSDLTQEVRGFVVASQMTVRNAIDILRKAFFFDVTEYDGRLVCVNRGHDAIATIPDADLAAHEPGTQPPDPLEVTRAPEAELPRTVYIKYYESESDYQPGSQYWRRTVTSSQSDVTLDLPVVFTATEALMRAQWHMHFAWLERDRYTWYTTRKWAKLVPTDVVVVRGVNIRITTRTESPNGLIKFEGVRAFAGPYSAPITEPIGGEVPGAPGSGQPPQTPPGGATAATGMILIDGPWISESDSTTAIRAALYRSGTGPWPGATVYKSVDGGTSYTAAGSTTAGAVVGTVASALGDFAGGNVADETNVITVVLQSGTLDSTTADGLINGLNLIALGTPDTGWEFLQYRTATLVGTDTYELSGLLRGRFGTEWMMPDHAAGESLVLVSSTILIAGSAAEIGLSRKYKPVTLGAALASATAQDFTNSAVALKPYAPVLLGGGRDASGNLTLNWTSRRRGSGGWPNGVDLPATDPTNWQVDIYDDGTYTTNLRSYGITDETVDYSAADQTTDFGSPQATVYWTVAQIGSTGLGYTTQAAT